MFIPNVTTDILQFVLKYMLNDKFYVSTGRKKRVDESPLFDYKWL